MIHFLVDTPSGQVPPVATIVPVAVNLVAYWQLRIAPASSSPAFSVRSVDALRVSDTVPLTTPVYQVGADAHPCGDGERVRETLERTLSHPVSASSSAAVEPRADGLSRLLKQTLACESKSLGSPLQGPRQRAVVLFTDAWPYSLATLSAFVSDKATLGEDEARARLDRLFLAHNGLALQYERLGVSWFVVDTSGRRACPLASDIVAAFDGAVVRLEALVASASALPLEALYGAFFFSRHHLCPPGHARSASHAHRRRGNVPLQQVVAPHKTVTATVAARSSIAITPITLAVLAATTTRTPVLSRLQLVSRCANAAGAIQCALDALQATHTKAWLCVQDSPATTCVPVTTMSVLVNDRLRAILIPLTTAAHLVFIVTSSARLDTDESNDRSAATAMSLSSATCALSGGVRATIDHPHDSCPALSSNAQAILLQCRAQLRADPTAAFQDTTITHHTTAIATTHTATHATVQMTTPHPESPLSPEDAYAHIHALYESILISPSGPSASGPHDTVRFFFSDVVLKTLARVDTDPGLALARLISPLRVRTATRTLPPAAKQLDHAAQALLRLLAISRTTGDLADDYASDDHDDDDVGDPHATERLMRDVYGELDILRMMTSTLTSTTTAIPTADLSTADIGNTSALPPMPFSFERFLIDTLWPHFHPVLPRATLALFERADVDCPRRTSPRKRKRRAGSDALASLSPPVKKKTHPSAAAAAATTALASNSWELMQQQAQSALLLRRQQQRAQELKSAAGRSRRASDSKLKTTKHKATESAECAAPAPPPAIVSKLARRGSTSLRWEVSGAMGSTAAARAHKSKTSASVGVAGDWHVPAAKVRKPAATPSATVSSTAKVKQKAKKKVIVMETPVAKRLRRSPRRPLDAATMGAAGSSSTAAAPTAVRRVLESPEMQRAALAHTMRHGLSPSPTRRSPRRLAHSDSSPVRSIDPPVQRAGSPPRARRKLHM